MSASRALRAVEHEDTDETVGPDYTPPREEVIMEFEGQPVHFAVGKVTSAANLEIGDKILKMDDKIVLVLELRVNDIQHKVNDNTGKMTRVQGMKAIEAFVCQTDFETLKHSGL